MAYVKDEVMMKLSNVFVRKYILSTLNFQFQVVKNIETSPYLQELLLGLPQGVQFANIIQKWLIIHLPH